MQYADVIFIGDFNDNLLRINRGRCSHFCEKLFYFSLCFIIKGPWPCIGVDLLISRKGFPISDYKQPPVGHKVVALWESWCIVALQSMAVIHDDDDLAK